MKKLIQICSIVVLMFIMTSMAFAASITLTWVAPTQYIDGTPLPIANIKQFNVYWGTSAGVYPNSVSVTSGIQSAMTYTLSSFATGTYYYAISAVEATGIEGAKSAPIGPIFLSAGAPSVPTALHGIVGGVQII